jgi:hypothetical protein
MPAVSILKPVSIAYRRMGRIVLYKNAADPLEVYGSAAERRKRGCTAGCGDRSGAGSTGTGEKQDPHFAYNKTIPYRFVSVNDAAVL